MSTKWGSMTWILSWFYSTHICSILSGLMASPSVHLALLNTSVTTAKGDAGKQKKITILLHMLQGSASSA